eukprot:191796-Rhodomonas_salina.4
MRSPVLTRRRLRQNRIYPTPFYGYPPLSSYVLAMRCSVLTGVCSYAIGGVLCPTSLAVYSGYLHPTLYNLHPRPCTLFPSTLLHPSLYNLLPRPWTPDSRHSTSHPLPHTLDPRLLARDPRSPAPCTLNPDKVPTSGCEMPDKVPTSGYEMSYADATYGRY